jgi:DNA-binding response OmpR family regulator
MKILVAEDSALSRKILETTLQEPGYELLVACDGEHALELLERPDAPALLILDRIMPGMDGIEVCRKARQSGRPLPHYIILLTSRGEKRDIVEGLEAGADDYVTKPFDEKELRARVQVGVRVLDLQSALAKRATELEEALARVRTLEGLVPICSYCKKIRNDKDFWQEVELYVEQHSRARFSHGICPACYQKIVKPQMGEALEQS